MLYENILFYNKNFYCEKEHIKLNYTHNILKDKNYIFKPLNIESIKINSTSKLDTIIILLDHFHFNPAHNLWDHLYPLWYRLFENLHNLYNSNFQIIINKKLDRIFGIQHIQLLEIFSGYKPITLQEFSNKFNKPIIIKYLVTGLEGIGIGHVNKNNLTVSRGLEINNKDPIETFVNRIYYNYNIKRNSLLDKSNLNECNNIIYIKNKRLFTGIEELFHKLNIKYKGKYNFKIIDYSKYNFEEQLKILNTTSICIVGVGTARFNTPFLPNGAIEIQTFQPNIHRKNFMEYIDYHGGTLSKNVKIRNIPYYTKEEAINNTYSHLLEEYIKESINEIPCKTPVNLENNIPKEVLDLRKHKNYHNLFDEWRNHGGPNRCPSNIIEHFMDLLN